MKRIFVICLCCFCFFSCEDFLKEKNVTGIGYDYYETESGCEAAVISAYPSLRFYTGGNHYAAQLMVCGSDLWQSTNVAETNPWNEYWSDIDNQSLGDYNTFWNEIYKAIQNCNLAINRINKLDNATGKMATEAGKNQRLGEAYFLRAYYYYVLINIWGSVPLLLDENTVILNEIKRAPLADIYTSMISDLTFAAEHLPQEQAEYARPTQAAAQSFLAKIYLTRGSAVTENRGQQPSDMDNAILYAQKVIDYKGDLQPEFYDVYDANQEKNKDVLFAVQFTNNQPFSSPGNVIFLFFTMSYNALPGMFESLEYGGYPYARVRPTDYLYDLYDLSNDSRFYKTFQTLWLCNVADEAQWPKWTAGDAPSPELVGQTRYQYGDTAIYVTMQNNVPDAEVAAKPYYWFPRNKFTLRQYPSHRLHHQLVRNCVYCEGSADFKLLYLSDTYLTIAEAYGRKGDYAKAVEYINKVRRRAAYKEGEVKPREFVTVHGGNPANLTSSTEAAMMITVEQINSPEKLRDFILDERGRELCGTYDRRADLLRTETFYDRVKKYNAPAAVHVQEYHKWRPIPQNHIDRLQNPGPVSEEQNPGYY